MVDQVFTKRIELMPADESIEQHATRRAEEISTVEQDRGGEKGLFKGLFSERRVQWMRDEADEGVLRCPGCGHEHIAGPICQNCGIGLEDEDGFSDMDDHDLDDLDSLEQDLDDLEGDLDDEIGAEFHHHHHHHDHRGLHVFNPNRFDHNPYSTLR